jgi:hypothetical protein
VERFRGPSRNGYALRNPAAVKTGGVHFVRPDGSDRRLLSNAEIANLA